MPTEMLRPAITLLLASISTIFFLVLRCQGKGSMFGRNSRSWAMLVVVVTSLLSTGAALVGFLIVQHLPTAFIGLGVIGPSGLWLSEIRNRSQERRSLTKDMSTLWLARFLARLDEGMAEDRIAWCERHIDGNWAVAELGGAARFYQEYLRERLSPAERRRSRINAQVIAIEARLTAVQLIESGASRTKILAALQSSRITKDPRYARYYDDLRRAADVLHHDAERDLVRLLGFGYNAGLYRMPTFTPHRRTYSDGDTAATSNPAKAGHQMQNQ